MTTLGLRTGDRSAHEMLAWARATVEPALRAAVDTLPASMHRAAGYHFGWCDEQARPHQGRDDAGSGKAFRPALALLSAQAVGGVAAVAVPAAAAVELVHNFSLMHDDVLDGDLTRRHRRTAWSVFGPHAAILTGDALLALALDLLATSGHPTAVDGMRMLSAAVRDLVDGQSADLAFEQRDQIEPAECLNMVGHKTGALIACSCALGALFGGGDPDQIRGLRGFGQHLGMAFQHVDDLLGIWGDPAVTGKPVYSDLRSRKKSLPVVAALNSDTPAGPELAALYRRTAPLSDTDLVRAADLVDIAGGRAWSQAQVHVLLVQAMRELESANPTARAARELGALASLATHRDS